MQTNSDDFEIKHSLIEGAGLGVFSKINIAENSYLHVKPFNTIVGVIKNREEIPDEHISHCIARDNDTYLCPSDFNNMEPVWYLNHSKQPNAEQREEGYFAIMPIAEGSEITIDYNSLGEPDNKKESFYRL